MNTKRDKIPELVQRLYAVVAELESLFDGRRFTPDGHLVGSIGEVIAAHDYGLQLLDASTATHDAEKNGRKIQIKATQGKSIALYSAPEHLLVLKLNKNGTTEEVYNGPGALAWRHAGKPQKNGQSAISLSCLSKLMNSVQECEKLAKAK